MKIRYFVEYCDGEVDELTRKEMIAEVSQDCKYAEIVVKLLEGEEIPEFSIRCRKYFIKKGNMV